MGQQPSDNVRFIDTESVDKHLVVGSVKISRAKTGWTLDKAHARHENRSPVVLLLEQLSREDSLTQDVFSLRINKYHLCYGFDLSST